MRKKANLVSLKYILMFLCVCACKNKDKPLDPKLEDKLILSFDAIIQADDEFQVYFKKDGENYREAKSIKQKIRGAAGYQKVVFVFKQLDFPNSLRIDLGTNIKQGVIKMKNVQLNYNGQSHLFTAEELNKYFTPNKFVDANFNELSFTPKVVDDGYDPFLTSYNISYFVNKLILY